MLKLTHSGKKKMEDKSNIIRLKVSKKALNRMRKDRLIRSPIYKGGVENGLPSKLTGSINWDI